MSARHPPRTSSFRRCPGYAVLVFLPMYGLANCAVYDDSLKDRAPLQGEAGAAQSPSLTDAGSEGLGGYSGDASDGGMSAATGSDPIGEAGDAGSAQGGSSGSVQGDGGSTPLGGGSAQGGGAQGGGAQGGSAQGGSAQGGSADGGAGGNPAATVKELAKGKPAIASSQQAGNEAPLGNDGALATRWCAKGGSYPQWWRVDLGASHALRDFTVYFEHADRKYTYVVETSQNDSVYVQQRSLSGTGAAQSDTFPANTSARYVRFTITAAAPDGTHATWACFFEAQVNGL